MRLILFLSVISITQWIFPAWSLWIFCLIYGWWIGYSPLPRKNRRYAVLSLASLWVLGALLGDASEKFYISHTLHQISSVPEFFWYLLTALSVSLPAYFFILAGQRLRSASRG